LTPRLDEMIRIVKSAKPLAHAKSSRNGSFVGEIPSVGNVIVFGYAETEDHPYSTNTNSWLSRADPTST
jgi:hypothetical protein